MNIFKQSILALFVIFSLFSTSVYARDLKLNFQTGGDDLRGGSKINIQVLTTSGSFFFNNINRNGSIPEGRRREYILPDVTLNSPDELIGIIFTHISGSCTFCTRDNWNMLGFTLSTPTSSGDFPLMTGGYHRFTGSQPTKRYNRVEFEF